MNNFVFDFIIDPSMKLNDNEITIVTNGNTKEKALQKAKNLLPEYIKNNIIKVYIHEEIE